jgi:hypothetical protein
VAGIGSEDPAGLTMAYAGRELFSMKPQQCRARSFFAVRQIANVHARRRRPDVLQVVEEASGYQALSAAISLRIPLYIPGTGTP